MKSIHQISLRYLKEQKKRTALTLLGIIISISMLTSIGTILVSLQHSEIESTKEAFGSYHVMFRDLTNEEHHYIENNPNIKETGRSVLAGTGYIGTLENPTRIELRGYDEKYLELTNLQPIEGRLPEKDNEIVMEKWVAENMGITIGDSISLPVGNFQEGEHILERDEWGENATFKKITDATFEVIGFLENDSNSQFTKSSRAIVSSNWAEKISPSDLVTTVVTVKDGLSIQKVKSDIQKNLELSEEKIRGNNPLLRALGQSGDKNMNGTLVFIVSFLVILVCLSTIAIIYNAFHISVVERIKQFGIIASIGTTPKQIKKIVLTEATILTVLGIPFGLLAGIGAMKVVFYLLSLGEFSSFKNADVIISPLVLILSSLIGGLSVYISALSPAIRASKTSPLDAIFSHRSLKNKKVKGKKGFLSKRILSPEGQIAYKNIQRNKKRFMISTFSMGISVILFIVFSVFSNYALKINDSRYDFHKDFYINTWVRYDSEGEKISELYTKKDLKDIKNIDGIKEVYPIKYYDAQTKIPQDKVTKEFMKHIENKYGNRTIEYNEVYLSGYSSNELDLAKNELVKGNIDINSMNNKNGVLIVQNNMVHDKNGKSSIIPVADFKVGDEIIVDLSKDDDENLVSFEVMGILEKNIIGEAYPYEGFISAITTEEVYENMTGENGYSGFHIELREEANRQIIAKELQNISGRQKESSFVDFAVEAKRARQAQIEISVFIYGFVALISFIALLNIINTVSTNLLTRTKELGMLRAVGMGYKSMKKMIRLETTLSALFGVAYGMIIGNILGYILYSQMSDIRGFMWIFPWKANGIALVFTLLFGLLASIAPIKRVKNMNIIDTLREE